MQNFYIKDVFLSKGNISKENITMDEDDALIAAIFNACLAQDSLTHGMTDGYAMEKYGELFIPFAWTVK
jgi:hypothetical protein